MKRNPDRVAACVISSVLLNVWTASIATETPRLLSDAPTAHSRSVSSVVKRFDFDSEPTGLNSLPPHFYRYVAPRQGFLPFGEMRVVDLADPSDSSQGRSRNAVLEFILDGGSMSARIGTSVVPILPLTDYIVSCRVCTDGLRNARARITAWFCDAQGREIAGSRRQSRLIDTEGRWDLLTVELHGDFVDAADLVFELQVIQPGQRELGTASTLEVPAISDIVGRVWFDEVTIAHLPRVELRMMQSDHVIVAGERVDFAVAVHDLTSKNLLARLRIVDIDGQIISEQTYPAPRGREPTRIAAEVMRSGWYRGVLEILEDSKVVRRRFTDFLVVHTRGDVWNGRGAFGVWYDDTAQVHDAVLARRLGMVDAIVPAWNSLLTLADLPQYVQNRTNLIESLLGNGARVIFSLKDIPQELIRASSVRNIDVPSVLSSNPSYWRPYLDDLFMNYGLSTSEWIMADASDPFAAGVGAARTALSRYVPSPQVYLIHSAETQRTDALAQFGEVVLIPSSVSANVFDDVLTPWKARDCEDVLIVIETLSHDDFSPRQRFIDALHRGLQASKTGAGSIICEQPWTRSGDSELSPDPVALAWNVLNTQLSGRRFIKQFMLDGDIHAMALRGESGREDLLIVWSDRAQGTQTAELQIHTGTQPLKVIDSFGNPTIAVPQQQMHRITVGDLPLFIPAANLELALVRGGIAFDPPFVPAASRMHEHALVIRNPWDIAITGRIRIGGVPDLGFTPASQEFFIAAQEEARLPIQIIPQRGILAGMRQIPIELEIHAEKTHVINIGVPLEVGLREIELSVVSSINHNRDTGHADLLISAAVTNHSTTAVHVDVDLLAENVNQMRRTIASLQPGQTQIRTFVIDNGARTLAGQTVRIGVSHRDGIGRLNRTLTISPEGEVLDPVITGSVR